MFAKTKYPVSRITGQYTHPYIKSKVHKKQNPTTTEQDSTGAMN